MKWLNEEVGTAAFNDTSIQALDPLTNIIVDVRDLVDKSGNDVSYVGSKIDEALSYLNDQKKVIICCDYGLSRSNSVAIGVLVKRLGIPFSDAVSIAKKVVDESGIKIEMLNTVFSALYHNSGKLTDHANKNKNILITGANGFLGKQLQKKFSGDYRVTCPSSKEVDLIENVVELDLLVKANNINTLVHLANPKVYTNTRATGDTLIMLKNVLDVCRTNDLKLVYLSSWEIYSGYKTANLVADANLQPNPKGTYGETKWLCDLLVKQYVKNYGIKYQIIRPGPVYGPGSDKPKFIYNFINKALKDEKIITHKYLNGLPSLDLLFIEDVLAFLYQCITNDYIGEINIGSGISTNTFKVASVICEITGSKSQIDQVLINDYSSNILMDNFMAKQIFSWAPEVELRNGITKILEQYIA
jgi:UDP-glucuronate decarboxylase